MNFKIFTVYDSKAEAFMQPFFMQTTGSAIRAFTDSVNDSKTQFYHHPADFTLMEIGEYDDQKGILKNHETKKSLGLALEYKKEASQQNGLSMIPDLLQKAQEQKQSQQ